MRHVSVHHLPVPGTQRPVHDLDGLQGRAPRPVAIVGQEVVFTRGLREGTVVQSGPLPKWVLVADDDNGVREVWTAMLTQGGYRVLAACNGREALDLMRAVIPDLVILDLRMPEMDGPALLKVLDGAPVLARIPVLIVSGFLEDADAPPSLGLNIVGCLAKPLRQADLLGAVQAALAATARPA